MTIATLPLRGPNTVQMPPVGVGTWRMGEDPAQASAEVAALHRALDLGFTHFDTAEMYGEGGAEEVLGRAIAGHDREGLFLCSKVYPWNAGRRDMVAACEASLARLGTDRIDLYLLHWPGGVPFAETLEAAGQLLDEGKIAAFGVSNFDTEGLQGLIDAGQADLIAVNQVMHNIPNRGPEHDLFPLMKRHDIAAVAYCPLEIAPTRRIDGIEEIAETEGLSVAQLALAWHMTRGLAVPIPKSSTPAHVEELWTAANHRLSAETLAAIDARAPAPDRPVPLQVR